MSLSRPIGDAVQAMMQNAEKAEKADAVLSMLNAAQSFANSNGIQVAGLADVIANITTMKNTHIEDINKIAKGIDMLTNSELARSTAVPIIVQHPMAATAVPAVAAPAANVMQESGCSLPPTAESVTADGKTATAGQ